MIFSENKKLLTLAEELATKILGEQLAFDTDIEIEYDKELDVEAEVYNMDGEFTINIRPELENLRTAIAHELIHVKQYLDGRLVDTDLGQFWEGKFIDTNRVRYIDLPWEKEAHALEGNY